MLTLQVSVLRLNSERGDLQAKRDQMISSNSELVGLLGGKLRPACWRQRAAKQGLVLAPVELISSGSLGR